MNILSRIMLVLIIVAILLSPGALQREAAAGQQTRYHLGDAREEQPDYPARSNADLFDFPLNITYAIISPELFVDELQDFKDWKIQKGVPAHIFTTAEISKRYSGRDLPEKIHEFLQELVVYKSAVVWLLLVGDHDLIPSPLIRTDVNGSEVMLVLQDFAYSDYYYSGLDTDWDHDNDGILGERLEDFDWSAKLNVGRLPVSNVPELKIVLAKLDNYERNPPEDPFYNNIILAGAVMDINTGPNIEDDPDTWQDDGYNNYKDNALKVNEKIKKLFPPDYNFREFYDYRQLPPGNYDPKGDTLNHLNFNSAFNSGASIVNIVSHGYDNGDGHVEYSGGGEFVKWESFFDYNDAESAKNGVKLPLVYSSSCTSGNFTEADDTGLERLLTAKNGGAIGFVGATVTTYRGEFRENNASYGNWWLNEHFWKLFTAGDHKPGRVLYDLKEDYEEHVRDSDNPYGDVIDYHQMFRVNLLAYNYLGDPELSIRTRSPSHFMVDYEKVHKPQNWQSQYSVRVKDQQTGEVVENARVAIWGSGQYDWAETDSEGRVSIDLSAEQDQFYKLTVTADDYKPFETQFSILPTLNLKLTPENFTVSDNRLNEGAQTNITLEFKNNGEISATEVELAFYDGAPSEKNRFGPVYSFENVRPEDSRMISVPWIMTGGDHNIIAVVDPDNKLMEFNETDNSATVSVYENNPPVFYKLPVIPVVEDNNIDNALLLTSYVWDPDIEDIVSFRILKTSEPLCKVTVDGNNYLDIELEENWFGQCNVTIEVTDGIDSSIAYAQINVASENDPPVLKQIQNQTLLEEMWFEIKLFGSDHADGDDIHFESDLGQVFPSLVNGDTLRFNDKTGELRILPDNSMVGVHYVNFRVVDENGGESPWQEVSFTVINDPDPPVIDVDNKYTINAGERFILKIKVIDEDAGDKIVFWDDSDLFEIDPDTGEIEFTPESADAGKHRVTIFVSDGNFTIETVITFEIEKKTDYTSLFLSIVIIVIAVGAVLLFAVVHGHKRRLKKIKEGRSERLKSGGAEGRKRVELAGEESEESIEEDEDAEVESVPKRTVKGSANGSKSDYKKEQVHRKGRSKGMDRLKTSNSHVEENDK